MFGLPSSIGLRGAIGEPGAKRCVRRAQPWQQHRQVTMTGVQAAAPETLEGELLKVGAHTSLLHTRFVSLRSGGDLVYWESRAKARSGSAPRGGGVVVSATEWWPSESSAIHAMATTADSERYDGCTFEVRLSRRGSKPFSYRLVAHSPAERRRWLLALTAACNGAARPDVSSLPLKEDVPMAASDGWIGASCAGESCADSDGLAGDGVADVHESLPLIWASWNGPDADEGARQRAAEDYAALLRRFPSSWNILQDRGNFHLSGGDLRKAEVDLSSALELHPGRAELWNDRAACRTQAGRHEDAISDAHKALGLWPKFAQAHSNLGNAYRAMGHLDAAMSAYNAALLSDPLDARTWNNRGALQEERGNLVAAELDVRRALELEPSHEKARANRERIASKLLDSDVELQPLQPIATTGPALSEIPPPGAVDDVGATGEWQPMTSDRASGSEREVSDDPP
jgi:tetratricopeptide (TPR) repeat protein